MHIYIPLWGRRFNDKNLRFQFWPNEFFKDFARENGRGAMFIGLNLNLISIFYH